MAIGFIWKKQLVMFITMFIVVFLGLTIGALLQDRFRVFDEKAPEQTQGVQGQNTSAMGSYIQVPSLAFPTTQPGVTPPPAKN